MLDNRSKIVFISIIMEINKGDQTVQTIATLTRSTPGIRPEELLKVEAKGSLSTDAYRRGVRSFLSWAGERVPTAELFATFIENERQEGSSASKLNRDLYGCKAAILQAAQRQGMAAREVAVLKSALDSIPGAKVNAPEIRVVSSEERARLMEALPLRVRLVARLLYATAARVSEALEVKLSDLKADGDRVLVRFHGKGRKERWVKIPATLLEEINGEYAREGRAYLFETQDGGAFSRQYVTREIARAAKRVLRRRITAHDLRHSRATDLFQKTKRLKGVSEMLGHASTSTTARFYVQDSLTDDELFNGENL
jgi:integrase